MGTRKEKKEHKGVRKSKGVKKDKKASTRDRGRKEKKDRGRKRRRDESEDSREGSAGSYGSYSYTYDSYDYGSYSRSPTPRGRKGRSGRHRSRSHGRRQDRGRHGRSRRGRPVDVWDRPAAAPRRTPPRLQQLGNRGSGDHAADLEEFVDVNMLDNRTVDALRSLSDTQQKRVMGTDGGENSFTLKDKVNNPNAVVMSRIRKL
mmetsp:Transcript_77461/g.217219  ORF Transcript_77461/g.217219 Transcript_77461/m.217219 type:complete len:203 (+) Transcript_77461:65-673(+)